MLFNSYLFIFLFLPIVLIGFYQICRIKPRYALIWLVIASLFFYGWWDPRYLVLILISIGINYGLGLILLTDKPPLYRKSILTIGIVFNLGLLAYFKYANFIVDNLNLFGGLELHLNQIILPLAISFFTFQQIAFLVDTYLGLTKEYNFSRYCFFITFFPQLIAGPIVHHKEMIPQLDQKRFFHFNQRNLTIGLTLFCLGLFKKVMIADHLSLYATPVFNAASHQEVLTFFEAWGGALAYTFQLYFDFSGYSDMALGLSKIFGLRLPLNFNSPYKATSLIDFWRRWHMTLSRFLRDYLYIPLGGNKQGAIRRYLNLLATMLIGGMWHGAGWTFLLWGALHGFYLMVNHAWRHFFPKIVLYKLFSCMLTFLCVVVGWVFFRANHFSSALSILKSMFGINGIDLPHRLQQIPLLTELMLPSLFRFNGLFANNLCHWPSGIFWIILSGITVFILPNSCEFLSRYHPTFQRQQNHALLAWRPSLVWSMWVSLLAVLALLHLSQMSEFLYFQF